ncbi:MAG: hypothetical protein JW902_14650 [Syntrophaceae bacterium]|nr:hypothetical protein [Syntrophaceae bacterium]
MYSEDYDAYLEEMADHCRIALDAMGELNFAMLNLRRLTRGSERYHYFHNAIFHSLYFFLSHANVISGMLWPDTAVRKDSNKNSVHARNALTKQIKRKLGPTGRKCLNNQQLEVGINQFIEQRQKPGVREYYDRNIVGPCLGFMYSPVIKEICTYDPISRIFSCGEALIQIDDLAAAIYKLQTCINQKVDHRTAQVASYPVQSMQMIS